MSTILDALRKVQNEREPRDLQDSLTQGAVGTRAARRWPRRLLWLVVLASLAGGGVWLWQGPQGAELWQTYVASAQDEVVAEAAPVTPAEPREGAKQAKLRRETRARNIKRAAAARLQAQEARAQAAATAPATVPAAGTRQPRTAREAAAAAGPSAASARVAARAPARGREPAEPVKVVSKPARPTRAAAPSGPTLARPRTEVATRDVEPEPVAREPVPRPKIELGMRLEPVAKPAEDPEPEIFLTGQSTVAFPELSVERVSWHPVAERRSARMRLDGTRPIDAREGDIIAGVAIERIDPGAVEVRMGDVLRLLQLGQ